MDREPRGLEVIGRLKCKSQHIEHAAAKGLLYVAVQKPADVHHSGHPYIGDSGLDAGFSCTYITIQSQLSHKQPIEKRAARRRPLTVSQFLRNLANQLKAGEEICDFFGCCFWRVGTVYGVFTN